MSERIFELSQISQYDIYVYESAKYQHATSKCTGKKKLLHTLPDFKKAGGAIQRQAFQSTFFIQQRHLNDIIDPYLIQTIILRIYHDYGDGQSFISCPAPLQKLLTNNYNSLQLCAQRIMISQIKSRAKKQECQNACPNRKQVYLFIQLNHKS